MAQLTLGNITTYVNYHIPDFLQARVAFSANLVLKRIHRRIGVISRSTITTLATTTTGTVQVTEGSVNVTFTNAVLASSIAASGVMRVIQVDGTREWFNLTRSTDNTGTLSSAWPTDTNNTASFTIAYPLVTFPSTVLAVQRMWMEGYRELLFAGDEKQDGGTPGVQGVTGGRISPGRPIWWGPYDMDTTGTPDDLVRRMLLPWPDQAYVIQYSYLKRPTVFDGAGSSGQTTGLPAMWDQVIIDGTLYHSFVQQNRRENAAVWRAEYDRSFGEACADLGAVSRMGDTGEGGIWIEESWPVGG